MEATQAPALATSGRLARPRKPAAPASTRDGARVIRFAVPSLLPPKRV
jgi:hypothetical protein